MLPYVAYSMANAGKIDSARGQAKAISHLSSMIEVLKVPSSPHPETERHGWLKVDPSSQD
jgi:hypothetical protein